MSYTSADGKHIVNIKGKVLTDALGLFVDQGTESILSCNVKNTSKFIFFHFES